MTERGGSSRYRFKYDDGDSFQAEVANLGLRLPWSDDVSPLFDGFEVGAFRLPNRLAVHPMEGFDAVASGAPGELSIRRYERYAAGGAGTIWFEATAVNADGRSNPHQMYLHRGTASNFAKLVDATRSAARNAFGPDHTPLLVLQLTHSGRWSRPSDCRKPFIAFHNSTLDELVGIDSEYPLVTDDDLDCLQEDFVRATQLAADAGFDAIDIKACHGYLVSELLAAFTREGRYGGSFENRTRFLVETALRVRDEVPSILVASRLNAYDGLPYPHGFGVNRNDPAKPDLEEPRALLSELRENRLSLANISVGVPYSKPHLGRPFSWPVRGSSPSPEHPLFGVSRLLDIVATLQHGVKALPMVGTGYSWLRQFFPHVAAGAVAAEDVTLAGVGRLAFAYPDFARDLFEHGTLNPAKCCLACSGCTELMRAGGPTGCIVRDRDFYRLPRRSRARKD
jgi:2,4-dienoyl-CoA reductase-like NADH-dependent reductase (Old Yellow Enzyme family)